MSTTNDTLFGRVAVAAKVITQEQLDLALREQARRQDGRHLGHILLELKLVTQKQLEVVVQLQKEVIEKSRAKKNTAAGPPPAPAAAAPQRGAAPRGPAQSDKAATARAPAPAATVDETEASAGTVRAEVGSARRPDAESMSMHELLEHAARTGASDLHVHAGAALRMRVRGRFIDLGSRPLDPTESVARVHEILSVQDREELEKHGQLDLSFEIPGVGRVRANAYRQLRGIDAAFRMIPIEPPTLESLGLPSALARFMTFHQGMVLVTGPARCGKSSTLAALVRLINEDRSDHILTIEDPIEYRHPSARCLVNQRSVKRHTESFSRALRAALREDPDIIVIGELRDPESISLALTAAETGHFVLGTLHTDNAVRTINRIVGAFPPEQHDQIRSMLSESLRAVISQRLLPTADGNDQAVALEVMIGSLAIGNLIRENKTIQLRSALQTGSAKGMMLLDQSLADLVKAGRVKAEDALRHCEDPKMIPT
jgi:twitching motility protein PilT